MDKNFLFYTYPQAVEGFQQGFEQKQNPKRQLKRDGFFTYPQAYYDYCIIKIIHSCHSELVSESGS